MKKTRSAGYGWVVLGAVLWMGGLAWAGTNNFSVPPSAPGSSASAMYTLEDLYQRINMPYTNVAKRTGAFAEPAAMPTNGTLHTLDDIMAVTTSRSAVARTGQTTSYYTGDDGNLKKGVVWPSPRFVTNNVVGAEVVILDKLTGLMWTKDASNACAVAGGKMNWGDAVTNCNNLSYGGYDDWRLPNVKEMISLVAYGDVHMPAIPTGHPFLYVMYGDPDNYWTSTTTASAATSAWKMWLRFGGIGGAAKTTSYYVWPVRNGP